MDHSTHKRTLVEITELKTERYFATGVYCITCGEVLATAQTPADPDLSPAEF